MPRSKLTASNPSLSRPRVASQNPGQAASSGQGSDSGAGGFRARDSATQGTFVVKRGGAVRGGARGGGLTGLRRPATEESQSSGLR